MKKLPVALTAICMILIVACAALGYIAWSESYALYVVRVYSTNVALAMRYGTVVSVDPANSMITISMYHTPDNADEPVQFHVASFATISYEALTTAPGVTAYNGITQPQPATLADIHPGDHTVIYAEAINGSLLADEILFGNPL